MHTHQENKLSITLNRSVKIYQNVNFYKLSFEKGNNLFLLFQLLIFYLTSFKIVRLVRRKSNANAVSLFVKCKKLEQIYKKLFLIIYIQQPIKAHHLVVQFLAQQKISSKKDKVVFFTLIFYLFQINYKQRSSKLYRDTL